MHLLLQTMRRRYGLRIVLLAFGMLFGIGLSLGHAGKSGAAPAAQVPLDEDRPWTAISRMCPGSCDVFPLHVPEPAILLAGEALTVTVAVRGICSGIPTPTHIVLVVDTDARMSKSDLRDLKQSLAALVRRLRLDENPFTRVGLVLVEERADIVVPVTNDEARLLRALNRIEAEGDLRLDEGLEAGLTAMRRARDSNPHVHCRLLANEIVFVMAPEPPSARCTKWVRKARKLKSEGILVASVCASRRCSSRCMEEIASWRRYVYDLNSIMILVQVIDRIRDEVLNITLRSLHVFEHLSPNLAYMPGSAVPPAEISEDGQRLHWQANFVPKEGITFTYQTRALAPGKQPAGAGTNIFWRDNQNYYGELQLAPSNITVFGQAGTPSH